MAGDAARPYFLRKQTANPSNDVAPPAQEQIVRASTEASVPAQPDDCAVTTHAAEAAVFSVLIAIGLTHMLNDVMQSLIQASYPILKSALQLDFGQVGLITLTFQLTASILQPAVGLFTDRWPQPFSLALGMTFTLAGLLLLSGAESFYALLAAVAMIGVGSSVFHPESSRVARMASGGRHGLAQGMFQVGGNAGQALGPLLAAFVVLPYGRGSLAWFSAVALMGIAILTWIGFWSRAHRAAAASRPAPPARAPLPRGAVLTALTVLAILMFSKFFYLASVSSYYTFYLIETFHVEVRRAELMLFMFLAATAAGTVAGGHVGDRLGRKFVIWTSIAGVLPFTLALPYANLFWTGALSVIIGFLLSSAFPTIVVYAQELLPGKVGTISGVFFGLAFGLGGLGAAALGELADATSIGFVYHVCAFLPALGLAAWFLPDARFRK
jgi:FSR family fosmidomycin resistance protein-like MFS transporter